MSNLPDKVYMPAVLLEPLAGNYARIARLTVSSEVIVDDDTPYLRSTPEREKASELAERADKLQAFKDFVHRRLDEMGIEPNPDGEHSKAGCRIGDRLDIVQTALSASQWIRAEDRLPEEHDDVVVWLPEIAEWTQGAWSGNDWYGTDSPKPLKWHVSHWQPIFPPSK